MLENEEGMFSLSPAYDLVNTALVIKNESEQMSLTLNGKKNKLIKNDFDNFGKSLLLTDKQIQNCYQSFFKKMKMSLLWVDNCFLSDEQKIVFTQIISSRIQVLTTD
jgi:serine/threonine-protein kinase HipA